MRYSIYLEADLVGGKASEDVCVSVPSLTIPPEYEGCKFLVRSSFASKNHSCSTLSGMRIGWYNTSAYNISNITDPTLLILGIAKPLECGPNLNLCYQYLEGECFVKMIDYPDVQPMTFNISTLEGNYLAAGRIYLNICFELR